MSLPPPRSTPKHSAPDTRGLDARGPRSVRGHPRHERAEATRSFASVALASGTGEDVAALAARGPKPRFRLDGRALRAAAIACLVVLCAVWASLAFAHPDSSAGLIDHTPGGLDASNAASGASVSDSQKASEQDASPSPVSEEGAGDGAGDGAGAEAPDSEAVVYVSGQVKKPGVYTLDGPARVNDAVQAAGGLTKKADPSATNLAAAVEDGQHIHVPAPGEPAVASGDAGSGGGSGSGAGAGGGSGEQGLININTASAQELEGLPGIGPSLSNSIVEWRDANGQFSSVDDLLDVSGIGNGKLEQLRDFATV